MKLRPLSGVPAGTEDLIRGCFGFAGAACAAGFAEASVGFEEGGGGAAEELAACDVGAVAAAFNAEVLELRKRLLVGRVACAVRAWARVAARMQNRQIIVKRKCVLENQFDSIAGQHPEKLAMREVGRKFGSGTEDLFRRRPNCDQGN